MNTPKKTGENEYFRNPKILYGSGSVKHKVTYQYPRGSGFGK
jgi:hypothetical protein